MHAYKVRLPDRLFEANVFDPRRLALKPALEAQVHQLLNSGHKFAVLLARAIAQDVHVEPRALLDERLPNSTRANHGNRFARNFVAEERQVRMPKSPLVVAHQSLAAP